MRRISRDLHMPAWATRGKLGFVPPFRLHVCWMSSWQVSSFGRVRSSTGLVSYGSLSCTGYRRVRVEGNSYMVHRLVAAAFLGPPPSANKWQVNHIDNDKLHNHVRNLEYVTASENVLHSWRTNITRRPAAKLGKAVLWQACGDVSWSHCNSQSEAARVLEVRQDCISQCCRGLTERCHGNGTWFRFKYADDCKPEPLAHDEVWKQARHAGEDLIILNLLVSSHGRVYSETCKHRFISRGYCGPAGYYLVKKAGREYRVHRLVAGTFLGRPPSPDMHVHHKDADRGNNHVENLEYVTPSQNTLHAYSRRTEHQKARIKGKVVEAQMGTSGSWAWFASIKDASAQTGVCRDVISRMCAGRRASSVGLWSFRFPAEETFPDEEWRSVVLDGARAPSGSRLGCLGHAP